MDEYKTTNMMVYLRYQDDGPVGMCGQMCCITNPWDQLHIFKNENKAHDFMREIEKIRSRKNARVTMIWRDMPDQLYPEVLNH